MLDAFKVMGAGGKKTQEAAEELQSLINAAREERAALGEMLTQLTMRSGVLAQTRKSLGAIEQAARKVEEFARQLQELSGRIGALDGRTPALEAKMEAIQVKLRLIDDDIARQAAVEHKGAIKPRVDLKPPTSKRKSARSARSSPARSGR